MKNKKSQLFSRLFKWLLLITSSIVMLFGLFKQRDTIQAATKKAVKKAKTEVDNWEENVSTIKHNFCQRFTELGKDLFIPHAGNDHRPKALRSQALAAYVVAIVVVKIFVTGLLFFIYPNNAFLSSKITDDLYALTNSARAEQGLPTLNYNVELAVAAQRKVDDMIAKNYFAHIAPDGKYPWQWINTVSYQFSYMGENLAMDFSSAKVVHSAFMNSQTHRANILHEQYTDVGIALKTGVIDGRETIILAQFFARPKPASSLAAASTAESISSTATGNTAPALAKQPDPTSDPVVEEVSTTDLGPISIEQPNETPIVKEYEAISSPPPTVTADREETEVINFNSQPFKSETNPQVLDAEPATTTMLGQVELDSFSQAQLVAVKQPGVQLGLVELLVNWSRNFLTLMLVIVSLLLLVNVAIKAHIQHTHVIAHSLLVIGLIVSLLLVRLHPVEKFIIF